jgi:hypothetical protein
MRKQSTMILGVLLISCLVPLMAFASIQEQIDAAVDGDIILIEPGTYVENINFNGKNIEVHSMGGPEVTIIDGNQNGSCVQIVNGEDSTAVLDGFTLTNGSGYQGLTVWIGGGLVVTNGSHPTLLNLIITGNTSTHGAGDVGGGLSIGGNSNPYLEGIIVSDNVSEYGGGISIYASNPTLHDVVISNNHANIGGGGIAIGLASNPLLSSILIFGNTGTYSSGGIFVTENATPIFNQVTVVDNIAPLGGGGMLASLNANPMFVNSIFWGNIPDQIYLYDEGVEDANTMTVAYSDIQGGAAGIPIGHGSLNWEAGNIDADPWFCDPEADLYTLSENSPCVGSGEDGVNMGALGVGCTLPVAINDDLSLPDQLALYQNYPNPFNPSTAISYELPGAGWVGLVVYDLLGREIVRVIDGEQAAGYHTITWNALDAQGHPLDAGIYLYRIQFTTDAGSEFSSVQKMSLVK